MHGQNHIKFVFPLLVVPFIVSLYTESCLTEFFAVVESVTDGDAVPSPAGILPQDQRSNLPVVRKKERDYMGMFEYRKEDEHIIVKHLVYGMSFVCLWYTKINSRRNDKMNIYLPLKSLYLPSAQVTVLGTLNQIPYLSVCFTAFLS